MFTLVFVSQEAARVQLVCVSGERGRAPVLAQSNTKYRNEVGQKVWKYLTILKRNVFASHLLLGNN